MQIDPELLMWIISSTLLGFIVWTGGLTWMFWRLRQHYRQLLGASQPSNLEQLLNQILKTQTRQEVQLDKLHQDLQAQRADSRTHLQAVGFQRFNPFQDTGGDQSFVLALLDDAQNGMVFSSLHNRDVTRLYAKPVVDGAAVDIPLSEEEKTVVATARHLGA